MFARCFGSAWLGGMPIAASLGDGLIAIFLVFGLGGHMNRWINMTPLIVFSVVIGGFPCLAQTPPIKLQVDVDNYVLYNYDTFDTTQFGTNPSSTTVPMKHYNYQLSIGKI